MRGVAATGMSDSLGTLGLTMGGFCWAASTASGAGNLVSVHAAGPLPHALWPSSVDATPGVGAGDAVPASHTANTEPGHALPPSGRLTWMPSTPLATHSCESGLDPMQNAGCE